MTYTNKNIELVYCIALVLGRKSVSFLKAEEMSKRYTTSQLEQMYRAAKTRVLNGHDNKEVKES